MARKRSKIDREVSESAASERPLSGPPPVREALACEPSPTRTSGPVGEETVERPDAMGKDPQSSDDTSEGLGQVQKLEYLAFTLSGEEYAIDIMKIREIIRLPAVTFVPRAPACILGILSLRGVIIPLIDLRRRMGLDGGNRPRTSRVIVVSSERGPGGFCVDAITGVVHFNPEEIEPPPSTLQGECTYLIRGVSRYRGRMIAIVDVERALGTVTAGPNEDSSRRIEGSRSGREGNDV